MYVIEAKEKIWDALRKVIDPELGINIVDLGLVYNVEVWPEGRAEVTMTMTTRACPLSGHLKAATEGAVYLAVPDLDTEVIVVWDPPWTPAMITPEGREQLGGR